MSTPSDSMQRLHNSDQFNEELNIAFLEAAGKGDIEALKALAGNADVDIHCRDKKFGSTALLWAAAGGHIPIVKYLLKKKFADISERNDEGESSLLLAAAKGQIQMVEYLVTNELSTMSERCNDGYSPLLFAACNGHIEMLKYLLNNKFSEMSERNNNGDSPLLVAARNGEIQMLQYLLNNKLSEISERNNQGGSPLCIAAYNGHLSTVQFFLKKGAFVDALTNSGRTPSQIIREKPDASKVALPLIMAAETLLKLAPHADGKSEEVSNVLNTIDDALNGTRVSDGNSALHLAILHKNKALVQILLERGADTELPNNDNRTPQQLALYSGVPYIKLCFNVRKIDELSKAPVAMELDTDVEVFKDAKETKKTKETKETKESKEFLEQSEMQLEALDKLIEETFKAIHELSEENERNELFYYLGVILSKADSPSFRPLLAYQMFNTITQHLFTPKAIRLFEAAHYKAYELIIGGHIIISKVKDQLEEELEILPNMGFIPNDEAHRSLRLKTLLKHLHLANYQDKDGELFSKLVAEFALGTTESMKGIPGLTGINAESQFILTNLLHNTRFKLEEENKRLKEEALEREQRFIREKENLLSRDKSFSLEKVELIKEKQKTDSENERLSAEIESLKSHMMDIDSVSQSSKKRKDNLSSRQDNLEPSTKRIRLENSIDVSKGSSPVLHHYESSKTEEAIIPQGFYSAQLAPVAKLNTEYL